MTTTTTQNKVARLNAIYAVVRRWQAGEIAWRYVQFFADLTDGELAIIGHGLRHATTREDLAKRIAAAIGL
jgi:hypothetical protein